MDDTFKVSSRAPSCFRPFSVQVTIDDDDDDDDDEYTYLHVVTQEINGRDKERKSQYQQSDQFIWYS